MPKEVHLKHGWSNYYEGYQWSIVHQGFSIHIKTTGQLQEGKSELLRSASKSIAQINRKTIWQYRKGHMFHTGTASRLLCLTSLFNVPFSYQIKHHNSISYRDTNISFILPHCSTYLITRFPTAWSNQSITEKPSNQYFVLKWLHLIHTSQLDFQLDIPTSKKTQSKDFKKICKFFSY